MEREIKVTIVLQRDDKQPISDSLLEDIKTKLNNSLVGKYIDVEDTEKKQLVEIEYYFDILNGGL